MNNLAHRLGEWLARLRASGGEFANQPIGGLHGARRVLGFTVFSGVFLVLLGALFVVLTMGLSWGNVVLASRPDSCQSCHEIQPAHEQWLASTHKGIGCLNCHVEPNLAGYAKINVNAVVNTVKHVSGSYEMPIQAQVEDSSCLKCHPKSTRPEELPQASLRIEHSLHEQQQCADCHGRVVHKVTEEVQAEVETARVQLVQAKSHAPSNCQVCHPSPKPEYVHGNASLDCASCHSANIPKHDLAVSQGVMARESCQECHSRLRVAGSPEECQSCHVSPHKIDERIDLKCTLCHNSPETWSVQEVKHKPDLSGEHAKLTCAQCHTASRNLKPTPGVAADCATCHKPPHGAIGDNQCTTCHSVEGWKPTSFDHQAIWKDYVDKHATATCNQCHQRAGATTFQKPSRDCASCHQPPPQHFGDDCAQCHKPAARFKLG